MNKPAPQKGRGTFDVAVIGGGIVGCATAMALLDASPGLRLVVLEKEARLAAHQTGHNSGVIHSGLYYRPGSLKAANCVSGREALYAFCTDNRIPHERCGKVVVASREEDIPLLDELERRGLANGLQGLVRLDPGSLKEREPHAAGVAGLFVPQTGIVDYVAVTTAMARRITGAGGEIRMEAEVLGIARQPGGFSLATRAGAVRCRNLINCAGLQCDRVAKMAGASPPLRIIPFRGEYYVLAPSRRHLVRNLIYPVPDPAFPFLGVHFTRMIDGRVEAGPNAVLAWKREGYTPFSFSLGDAWETLSYPGFWKLARRFWRVGLTEMRRSFSRTRFVRDLRLLVPELEGRDVVRGGAGVRAQAVDAAGALLDDFHILAGEGMVHVLNAPSPAATASLSIGRSIAENARETLDLG